MFTHADVWRGIDRLAKQHGMTPSGLARRAGLDPTTFNPSKRTTKQNKSRWPSTESLAKILTATSTPFDSFVALMTDRPAQPAQPPSQRLRCLAIDQAERERRFDDAGFPIGDDWDEIDFPNLEGSHAYALEISRRWHVADLSRRRPAGGIAGRWHPASRPGLDEDRRRRLATRRAATAHRAAVSSSRRSATLRARASFRSRMWPGSRGSCGSASKANRSRDVWAPARAGGRPGTAGQLPENGRRRTGGQSNREASQRQGGHRLGGWRKAAARRPPQRTSKPTLV